MWKNTIKDGVFFIADIDIPYNDSYQNPTVVNTNSLRYMRYREATEQYVWYNYYKKNDYVVYEGKTYRHEATYHSPNTLTQQSPSNGNRRKVVAHYPLNTWYRYKLYYKGDIIEYNGLNYECLQDYCNQKKPTDVQFWKRV